MNVRVVKASIPATSTKQIYDDPFKDHYSSDDIIQPPYTIKELKAVAEYSTILNQCVEAYVTNIVKFGIQPRYRSDYNAADKKTKEEMTSEWTQLDDFIRHLNFDESAETILGWAIADREKTGTGYIEVLRDTLNKPAGIEYADAEYMRICKRTSPIEVRYNIREKGKITEIKRLRAFRRFVQIKNGEKVWFKEYGDPRILNSKTGKFDENTPEPLRATEIMYFKIGSGTYGIPRWIGHLISLYGARKAEELNYLYFKQGRHTPAAVIIENGQLTQESYDQLQDYMNDIEGVENSHKFLVLEAEGIEETNVQGAEKPTSVKVQIKSLAEILQQDALFLEYDTKTRNKLRSAFRLPPLYTGESQEYTKATADTARKVTEEQVFAPNREEVINKINTLFLNDLEIYDVELMLKGPDFSDPLEIAKVLTPFISAGAVAPNDLRDLLGKVLGKTLEEWDDELFNKPLQLILKQAMTNQHKPFTNQENQNELVNVLKQLLEELESSKNKEVPL
jgi:PBSX family phage portal protein